MERRRTDRKQLLEMILTYVCQSIERTLNATSQSGSGRKSKRAKLQNAGRGQVISTHGVTGESVLTEYRGTPTVCRGSLSLVKSQVAYRYSTDATTLSASIRSTYSSVPNSTICGIGKPRAVIEPILRPITEVMSQLGRLKFRIQSRLKFANCDNSCGNPVETIPLFVTRNVLSGPELLFSLISLAVRAEQLRVLGYLEQAEFREQDVWAQQDYRTAQVVLILADEGQGNPYSKAFYQLWGQNAHQIRFWWRDRQKLYRLAEIGGSNTPLLHRDLAQKLEQLVPDYDPSADTRRALPPNTPCNAFRSPSAAVRKKPAVAATTGSGETAAGRKKVL